MIQFGNNEITEIYVGSDKVNGVYHGSDLVWGVKPPTPSYAILTDDTRVDFELENTPISNFATTNPAVVINGSTITKITIKELVFGDSYSNVKSIGINFLRNCSAITQLKIGAVNVPQTSGTGFLQNTPALTTILVPMQSVQAYKTTSPWNNHASKISAI